MQSNDDKLVKECEEHILENPCRRNMAVDGLGDSDLEIQKTRLKVLFAGTDFMYAFKSDDFYGLCGAQQYSPIHLNVWTAFTDNFEDHKTLIYKSTKRGLKFIRSCGFFDFTIVTSRVSINFDTALKFNERLGMEVTGSDGKSYSLAQTLGGLLA